MGYGSQHIRLTRRVTPIRTSIMGSFERNSRDRHNEGFSISDDPSLGDITKDWMQETYLRIGVRTHHHGESNKPFETYVALPRNEVEDNSKSMLSRSPRAAAELKPSPSKHLGTFK